MVQSNKLYNLKNVPLTYILSLTNHNHYTYTVLLCTIRNGFRPLFKREVLHVHTFSDIHLPCFQRLWVYLTVLPVPWLFQSPPPWMYPLFLCDVVISRFRNTCTDIRLSKHRNDEWSVFGWYDTLTVTEVNSLLDWNFDNTVVSFGYTFANMQDYHTCVQTY